MFVAVVELVETTFFKYLNTYGHLLKQKVSQILIFISIMKTLKSLVLLLILSLFATECLAKEYLVFMYRGGKWYYWVTENPPFKGDGIWIFGKTANPTHTFNGTTIDVYDEKSLPSPVGNASTLNPEKATAYFFYQNAKGVYLTKMDESSDWNSWLAHFKEKGCNQNYGIIWGIQNGSNEMEVNGKKIELKSGKVEVSPRGDILIGGEPVDIE